MRLNKLIYLAFWMGNCEWIGEYMRWLDCSFFVNLLTASHHSGIFRTFPEKKNISAIDE